MPFPSTLSTFTDPVPTDRLSTTPHSSIETAQNTGLRQIQAFIGADSSAVGTLHYDIRAAASNGGGHVQTANKGGTGQTSFSKGDILVASSSSVLSKLAVGNDTLALLADSTQTAGVAWGGVATATNIQNQTYTYARASVHSASVYGVVLNQAVSILSDGLGLVVKFPNANTNSVLALTVNAQGPSSLTALIKKTDLTNFIVGEIQASMIGVVEFDSVSSVFQLLNTTPLGKYSNGSATFTSSSTIGVVNTFPARSIRISAVGNRSAANARSAFSNGAYDSTSDTHRCVYVEENDNGTTATAGIDTSYAWHIAEGTNAATGHQGAISSITSTGFILVNTKTGGSNSANLFWEASG